MRAYDRILQNPKGKADDEGTLSPRMRALVELRRRQAAARGEG